MKPRKLYTNASQYAQSEGGRWETADGIEVCEGPAWHGRAAERRYVAQRLSGGPCQWGATPEAAAAAVRDAG